MNVVWHEELSAPASITGPVTEKRFIVIHWYGDPNTAGDVHATARYLAGVTHASVNYVAGQGHAYCLINPTQMAYAQGDGANGDGNTHGISIECDPRMRPEDLETVAHVIAKIRRDFGVNFPLRRHNEFTNTQCCGVWAGKLEWLSNRANEINDGQAAAPAPAPAPVIAPAATPAAGAGPYIPNDHWKVEKGETLTQVAAWARASVAEVARFNGISDHNTITVGERIWSPAAGADTYKVDPGDTLSGISQWYAGQGHSVSVQQLQYANGINDPSTEVKVGMRLLVP